MRLGVYAALALSMVLQQAVAFDTPSAERRDAAIVIVTSSAVEAFEEAVRGIQHALGPAAKVAIVDLASKSGDLANQIGGKDVRLLITVGNNALESAAQSGTAPILATMLLRADLAGFHPRPVAGAVALDVPLGDILSRVANILPGKTRGAIIRNPEGSTLSQAALIGQAKALGVSLKVLDCPRPEKLLQLFLSLRGEVDFVICPPDGTLFNSTTVRPLILASLDNRLPVVGFSESFVRSGAVAAVYPDYYDIGSQAGELARKYLAGAGLPANDGPRKLKVATNPRVARLLGLRVAASNHSDSGIVVIE